MSSGYEIRKIKINFGEAQDKNMSGFPPNGNDDRYLNQQYVNFDQFLVQHNIGNSPQTFYSPVQNGYYSTPSSSGQSSSHGTTRPPPFPPPPHRAMQQFLVENSNLLPTAKEFVPNMTSTGTDNTGSNFTSCGNAETESLPAAESNNVKDRNSNRRSNNNRTNRNESNNRGVNVEKPKNFNRSNQNRRNDRGILLNFFFFLISF